MTINELIKVLEQSKKFHGDTEVLIRITTNDSFNTVLTSNIYDVTIERNKTILSS